MVRGQGKTVLASGDRTSAKRICLMYVSCSDICRLSNIPYLEQAVKRPFDAKNAILLILKRVLPSEGLSSNQRPIIASIKVEKVEIGQENGSA